MENKMGSKLHNNAAPALRSVVARWGDRCARTRHGSRFALVALALLSVPIHAADLSSPSDNGLQRRDTAIVDYTGKDPYGSDGWFASTNNEVWTRLWPDGEIPYKLDGKFTEQQRARLAEAMAIWTSETNLTFRETDHEDSVWIKIEDLPYASGHAGTGRRLVTWQLEVLGIKGSRRVSGLANGKHGNGGVVLDPNCGRPCIAHELGHVAGLLHEHQRWDRDRFLRISPKAIRGNFARFRDSGAMRMLETNFAPRAEPMPMSPYDYTSVMHYGLEDTVPPGIPVGGTDSVVSNGDIVGMKRLYDFPLPSSILIETNPPNLEIFVDGKLFQTPHRVTWESGTHHTLEAPLVHFSASGNKRYLFGNWGGSGRASSVPTRIHVTSNRKNEVWYRANFIVQPKLERESECDPYCSPRLPDIGHIESS